jgi:hypothetical protein
MSSSNVAWSNRMKLRHWVQRMTQVDVPRFHSNQRSTSSRYATALA